MTKVAILDDWQGVAHSCADWSELAQQAELVFFKEAFSSPDDLVRNLLDFEVIIAMRERSAFPKAVIDKLANLRMIALTGARTWTMDLDACTRRNIVVCHTAATAAGAATAQLALALLLAAARHIPAAHESMKEGRFQQELPAGRVLDGAALGVIGLGKIGSRMARYGQALGMNVLACGRLTAALDVYDQEPLLADHPLRTLPNVVLTPHQGYCTRGIYSRFYRESIENVLAYLAEKPIRILSPDSWRG